MKKALLIIVVVLIPAITLAQNPDSRLSITLYGGINPGSWNLEYRSPGMSTLKDDFDVESSDFGIEFRWPQTQDITFILNVRHERQSYERSWASIFGDNNLQSEHNFTSTGFHVALRFYIGKSINK